MSTVILTSQVPIDNVHVSGRHHVYALFIKGIRLRTSALLHVKTSISTQTTTKMNDETNCGYVEIFVVKIFSWFAQTTK